MCFALISLAMPFVSAFSDPLEFWILAGKVVTFVVGTFGTASRMWPKLPSVPHRLQLCF